MGQELLCCSGIELYGTLYKAEGAGTVTTPIHIADAAVEDADEMRNTDREFIEILGTAVASKGKVTEKANK